jgi:hypothetical protein
MNSRFALITFLDDSGLRPDHTLRGFLAHPTSLPAAASASGAGRSTHSVGPAICRVAWTLASA